MFSQLFWATEAPLRVKDPGGKWLERGKA